MANPPVPLPPSLAGLLNRAPTNLVALNDPAGIPTNQEVVHENNRLLQIQHTLQSENGVLNDDDYSNAIIRHHRILSVRSDHDIGNVGNAAVLVQLGVILQAIQGIDGRLDGIDGRLDGIDGRLNLIETRRLVDRARDINSRNHEELNAEFLVIVKHTPGHPNFNPGVIPNVVFQAAYNIGDQPPNGLVPRTFARFHQLLALPLGQLRIILRGIYWFYNDPVLQVGANTNRANCLVILERVRTFLMR